MKWSIILGYINVFGIGAVDDAAFALKTEAEVNPAPLELECASCI